MPDSTIFPNRLHAYTYTHPTGRLAHPRNVYVVECGNHCVRKITPHGLVATFAGSGIEGSADGQGSAASFNEPSGIAINGEGIFVTDSQNHCIRKITREGLVTTFVGSGTEGSSDGQGTAARFASPYGIAVSSEGTLFVADHGGHCIRKVTPEGRVSTFAGRSRSQGCMDGPGLVSRFRSPTGVAIDGVGNVFVADFGNHRLSMIT